MAAFSTQLQHELRTSSECHGLEVLVDAGQAKNAKTVHERLVKVYEGTYWRLRVDYRPRMRSQHADLEEVLTGSRDVNPVGIGDSPVEDIASFVCKLAREGPAPVYW